MGKEDDPMVGGEYYMIEGEDPKKAKDLESGNEAKEMNEGKYLSTDVESGLTSQEASKRLEQFGYNELPEKEENIILKFLSFFWGPMPIMIWIAALVELIQCLSGRSQHWPDFGVLIGLQIINGTVGFFEEYNAGNAIAELKASLAPKANVKRDGKFQIIKARELVPGDIIVLQIGGVIPADCELLGALTLSVDQAALTGESLPVTMKKGDIAKMGATVKRGEMEAMVTKTGKDTFFGRAAGMVANVEQAGRFRTVLFNVMIFLMSLAVVLVLVILVILLLDNGTGKNEILTSIGTAVVLLIASIPIAMQVVATVTMAVGANLLASKKAIVARLSAIEELAGMHTLCSDKTGTLTLNQLRLDKPIIFDSKMTDERLILLSSLAAKRLDEGQDAIDTCIMNKALESISKKEMFEYEQVAFLPFDPSIKRTEATIENKKTGEKFKVTKGATPQILELCDSKSIEAKALKVVDQLADRGYRALGVAVTNEQGIFKFVGVLSLFDPPRVDTKQTIERAQAMGVQECYGDKYLFSLTKFDSISIMEWFLGDHTAIAIETARRLGMGTTIHSVKAMRDAPIDGEEAKSHGEIGSSEPNTKDELILAADGFAEVLPEDKFKIVEVLQLSGQIVGMTGDGVNDAPALKKAEIAFRNTSGIAVEGATDAARAAADIFSDCTGFRFLRSQIQVLDNSLIILQENIPESAKLLVAVFFRPENSFHDTDEKNFRLPVLAVVLITLVNDACVLTISRDNVTPAKDPQAWHLEEVFIVSAVLGFTAMTESVLLLLIGFSAGNSDRTEGPACIFFKDNCSASFGQVQSLLFLNLCLSDFITVFAARTRSWFFTRRPAFALIAAGVLATLSMTFIATEAHLGSMRPITAYTAVIVWAYTLIWFLIQDCLKMATYYLIDTLGIVDRSAYLNLVKQKPKGRMDAENIRKFSQNLRASVGKASIDYTFQQAYRKFSQAGGADHHPRADRLSVSWAPRTVEF
eukprot:jgi/Bigna1/89095/estExt_fgenesh1_pg.C_430098